MRRSRSRRSATPNLVIRYRRNKGAVTAFEITGHVGFAAAGKDIVCAGVSALVLSAAESLRRRYPGEVRVEDNKRLFAVTFASAPDGTASAIVETMLLGLEGIAASYPEHVRIAAARSSATGPARQPAKPRHSRPHRRGA